MERKKYYSVAQLLEEAISKAKRDKTWESTYLAAEPDYVLTDFTVEKYPVLYCSFDPVGSVSFGSSEGIYADLSLVGASLSEKSTSVHVLTIKSLSTSKEAWLALHELIGLISWYTAEFVNENLSHFD